MDATQRHAAIRIRDRETGRIFDEVVFKVGALRYLYESRIGRLLADTLIARPPLSHLYGWHQRSGRSKRGIAAFVETLGIDATLADRPLESYETLDDFFTRKLRSEVRPVDRDPDALVSCADSRLFVVPRLEGDRLRVKGSEVSIPELVGEATSAARYAGGVALVHRLAPPDYHRFHFPEGGEAGPGRPAGSDLHSVHPIALAAGAPAFRNKRVVTEIRTERFGTLAMIEVAAMLVGTIVQTYAPGRVERGAEKGFFRFGGSTVVVLVEPGKIAADADLLAWSAFPRAGGSDPPIETFVKMGTRIARRVA